MGYLVGCFVIFSLIGQFWLVGWFWFILVLVDCSLDRTTIISLIGFTEHKSSADHYGWQPGVSGHRKFETLLIV